MASATSWKIIESFAAALRNHAALNTWALAEYEQPLRILQGINMAALPREEDCPLIALVPESGKFGRIAEHATTIRVILTVNDERFVDDELAGLKQLATNFGSLVLQALQDGEDGFYIGEVTDLYELSDFPLLYRELRVTVTGSTCVGGAHL
ncbi:MAG: hypothetical protein ACERJ1_17925 [Halodesulfovibrio sp.]|uniref:hypothetical protein n=1 Tax=Halodesulfovibrio sp. TaxID=1912772 RepID=UPI00359DE838